MNGARILHGARRLRGDYRTDAGRLLYLSLWSIVVGAGAGIVAVVLLHLIGLVTHLSYDGTFAWSLVVPNPAHWGWPSVFVPVVGGLLVGLMARYGSDKIRGHGIPEAIQTILEDRSVMEPKVAVIKPLASAITIGTGGPFGAEGPIIMTGGAFGSLLAQWLPVTTRERRTLLVAGAAAGMAATFGSPISASLLAVELLLFEWSPRSFVPVTIASVVAYSLRTLFYGTAPVFGNGMMLPWPHLSWLWAAAALGVAAGIASGLLTKAVYFVEDAYRRLPIHWMWWPAIGGVFVGLAGLAVPQVLGVGYPVIRSLDAGEILPLAALALLVAKAVVWILALSSGTSGGVLAPLLMIGGALGALASPLLPGHLPALWATVGMAALLGGTMRAPFTATIFALETTHDWTVAFPVFLASVISTAVTVIWIPRSILTEKVARRGVHVAREYEVAPFERFSVGQAMLAWPPAGLLRTAHQPAAADTSSDGDASPSLPDILPVVDDAGHVLGAARRADVLGICAPADLRQLVRPVPSVSPTARLADAVAAMAQSEVEAALVVGPNGEPVGWLPLAATLAAWRSTWTDEHVAQRIFKRVRRVGDNTAEQDSPDVLTRDRAGQEPS
ncbi:MAG: chloride channel protein [Thermaerobacter sp.]|nr:chloride channel protein [Thermaerobacter sp.]